jgi:hypothetical protein
LAPQARPAAPSQSSAPLPPSNYRPVVRKEIVDDSNIDPDFR